MESVKPQRSKNRSNPKNQSKPIRGRTLKFAENKYFCSNFLKPPIVFSATKQSDRDRQIDR